MQCFGGRLPGGGGWAGEQEWSGTWFQHAGVHVLQPFPNTYHPGPSFPLSAEWESVCPCEMFVTVPFKLWAFISVKADEGRCKSYRRTPWLLVAMMCVMMVDWMYVKLIILKECGILTSFIILSYYNHVQNFSPVLSICLALKLKFSCLCWEFLC